MPLVLVVKSRLNLTAAFILLAALLAGSGLSRADSTPAARFASLELKTVEDSSGCPLAVEVWLRTTTDTIQGLEALITWDRPGVAAFRRSPHIDSSQSRGKSRDTLASLSQSDNELKVECRFDEGLLSKWEYHEARGRSLHTTKITALAGLLIDDPDKMESLQPDARGLLCRLPINIEYQRDTAPDSDSVIIRFVPGQVRLSNTTGQLIDSLILRSDTLDVRRCQQER